MRRTHPLLLATALAMCAGPVAGQTDRTLRTYADDLARMETKFIELAGAMGADTYGWRPMEAVRSVSEVYMLIAAEAYYLPTLWDVALPEGVPGGEALFSELSAVTDREGVLEHLERAFDHAGVALEELPGEALERRVDFFGRERPLAEALYILLADMHEHLGQAIAYARSNRVVPPWTAREESGG